MKSVFGKIAKNFGKYFQKENILITSYSKEKKSFNWNKYET